jgi:hypothetical protein
MKKTAYVIIFIFLTLQISAQKVWTSPKYSYSIWTPPNFTIATTTGRNIDYKVVNTDGSSLLVNVTPRQDNEYSFTPHDYTKAILETELKQYSSDLVITFFEKIYIDKQKAIIYHFAKEGRKCVECLVFVGDKVFMITGTTKKEQFSNYSSDFTKAIKSVSF